MQICCLPGVTVNPLLHTPHGVSSVQPTSIHQPESFSGLFLGLPSWAPGAQLWGSGGSLGSKTANIQGPGWETEPMSRWMRGA